MLCAFVGVCVRARVHVCVSTLTIREVDDAVFEAVDDCLALPGYANAYVCMGGGVRVCMCVCACACVC